MDARWLSGLSMTIRASCCDEPGSELTHDTHGQLSMQ